MSRFDVNANVDGSDVKVASHVSFVVQSDPIDIAPTYTTRRRGGHAIDIVTLFEHAPLVSVAVAEWKMNLISVAPDGRRLFIAANTRIAVYTLDALNGAVTPDAPLILLNNNHSDINTLRAGYYNDQPIVAAVDMSGQLHVVAMDDLSVVTITTERAEWDDCSSWSIGITPRYCADPYIVIGSNARRPFLCRLNGQVSSDNGAHRHNIPSVDCNTDGTLFATASIDSNVRICESATMTTRYVANAVDRQWGWTVRWFDSRHVYYDERTLDEKKAEDTAKSHRQQRSDDQKAPFSHTFLAAVDGFIGLVQRMNQNVAQLRPPMHAQHRPQDNKDDREIVDDIDRQHQVDDDVELEFDDEDDGDDNDDDHVDEENMNEVIEDGFFDEAAANGRDEPMNVSDGNAVTPSANPIRHKSSPSPPAAVDLLLFATKSSLYLYDDRLQLLTQLPSATDGTIDLWNRHPRAMDRLQFIETIPELSLIIIASSASAQIALFRLVRYSCGTYRFELDSLLPVQRSQATATIRGISVYRIDGTNHQRSHNVDRTALCSCVQTTELSRLNGDLLDDYIRSKQTRWRIYIFYSTAQLAAYELAANDDESDDDHY